MAIVKARKVVPSGGQRNLRAETTSIRLDPRLRYLSELACRKQRRSLNSFIEFAIENTLNSINIDEGGYNEAPTTFGSAADQLWDVDGPDRFAKLGLRYPELLTYEEQVLWKLLVEMPGLWKGQYDKNDNWNWKPIEAMLIFGRLREHWELLRKIARKEAVKTDLPVWIWSRHKPSNSDVDAAQPNPNPDGDIPPMDDEDIPF
jgi:hypothetical protein